MRISKLMCLIIVVLLVICMTVPVFAKSGKGAFGDYTYSWSITYTTSSGRATMTATTTPATVGAAVENEVYDNFGRKGYAYSEGSSDDEMAPIRGYVTAIAEASNRFEYNERYYTGTVMDATGYYWVSVHQVRTASAN